MNYLDLAAHNATLNKGDIVEARWTNCGHFYRGKARVVRVNPKTIVSELLEPVKTLTTPYPVGFKIKCPRAGSATPNHPVDILYHLKATANNGVFPVEAPVAG